MPLKVYHRTSYRYHQPVILGEHRLMLRPREGRDLRLISSVVTITPAAAISWSQDVFGNAVARVTFQDRADTLVIDSVAELELTAAPWPVFDITATAASYPFQYSDSDLTDLGALSRRQYPDPIGQVREWAQAFVHANPTDTLSLLKDLCAGVPRWIAYQEREAEGTQPPVATLERGWGACRDLAVLFLEAVRGLGFGARIVSGYRYDPDGGRLDGQEARARGVGATHAWAEVYVPGAGWITFDPTNQAVGGFNLIPVAVGRDIGQVMPVTGSYIGAADAFADLRVEVIVVS
ncbi:transglutaminase family protein [Nitrospirillum iridis]|uniref:Transglutaminase-like putative cysteine protease n=1 Tax=Nitrospirillum iridis TaxID=765888 RepID=A0A7X0AW31_9PROT|nr:transglutaminase family protein [Nitrospirillum iridis]MBB6250772.1 transglutaminase-like putative cysteine protease [Nitrospirillum iridis]